ncbi:MAG: response regulator, partial [Myxococcota bacterium]
MSKTILIVEDDRALSRMWTDLLIGEGFDVVSERDGEWALKTFRARHVDLVILDVLIPVKNGFQVAEKIRKAPENGDVPILMVSGIYRSARHRSEAMAVHDVIEYLDKPVKNERLIQILKRHFGEEYPKPRDVEAEKAKVDRKPAERFAAPDSRREVEEVEKASRTQFSGTSVSRGNLRSRPFPEILAELYRWKATGALLLKKGKVKKIVYFKDGYPTFVKSNLLGECLGKIMVRERMITEQQCERSLELMRSSGRQQGTVLMEMGLISPHNLVFALELQLRHKLIEPFGWDWGDYQFTRGSDQPTSTVSLDTTTASLIREGVKEKWPLERVLNALGSVDDQYVVPVADPLYRYQEMDLDHDEEVFFRRINGRRTVTELVDGGSLDHENAYQILYALRCAQMVEIRAEKAKRGELVTSLKPPKLPKAKPPPPPPLKKSSASGGRKLLLPEVAALAVQHSQPGAETERALKKKLMDDLERMRGQSYFEILGLSRSATSSDVRKAYFALAREYHPDKISGAMGDEVRELAGQIYDLISLANEVLLDPAEREAYVQQLGAGARKKEVSDEVSRILAAEGKFQRGETFMRQGRLEQASQAFREAIGLYPDEGEFHASLGWAQYQSAPRDPAKVDSALEHIMKAIQLNPRLDKAYLFLGYVYKGMGRGDKAEKQFEKAIQCNPDCT